MGPHSAVIVSKCTNLIDKSNSKGNKRGEQYEVLSVYTLHKNCVCVRVTKRDNRYPIAITIREQ